MPKELNGFKWSGIVTLVPNDEEFPHRCRQEDHAVKKEWEGRGPGEWRCDLARGGQTRSYTGSLLDDYNLASKEPMYGLFRPNHLGRGIRLHVVIFWFPFIDVEV